MLCDALQWNKREGYNDSFHADRYAACELVVELRGDVNIYIDESGSFVNASTAGAWNAVAALAVPETAEEKLDHFLDQMKRSNDIRKLQKHD